MPGFSEHRRNSNNVLSAYFNNRIRFKEEELETISDTSWKTYLTRWFAIDLIAAIPFVLYKLERKTFEEVISKHTEVAAQIEEKAKSREINDLKK